MDPVMEVVNRHMQTFVVWAQSSRDHERSADYLIEVIEEELIPAIRKRIPLASEEKVMEELIKAAKDPAEVEKIFVQVPQLARHAEWVRKVIAAAVRLMETPEEQPAQEGAPPAGGGAEPPGWIRD